ncbi:MAG TPA: PSD1 and planctomycete cytochrome C domain-containing protein [Bryobacteraceae bacterium]|nr:PSD1 and planctomycete cytochrome C domain-containing protein [Bryobacteraceae bacterium]
MATRITISTASIAALLCVPLPSQTPPPQQPNAEETAFFERNIRPIFATHCYGCHSSKLDKPMSGLLLDSRAGIARGGKSGAPIVVPGKPDESLLIVAVRRANKDLQMPPGAALEPYEIGNLVAWIKMGAPDPRTGSVPPAAPVSTIDWEKARQHWSFRPVQDPQPPATTGEWNASPVDRFIKAKLDEKKLTPQPRAAKLSLIRRVTYDLTGLPPTLEDIDVFVKDTTPAAFEKVVDRLLASQQYGERWGRHWLDVVRYADTAGDNADFPVPSMSRYRNWVIAAFNRDMPYDQFVRDQIAGDILAAKADLAAKDKEAWQAKNVATSYLNNSRRFGSRAAEMYLTLDDTIDNLGKGFLGLSVGCARCHDHKFDPIPSTDYYALYGIFKSTNYAHPGTEIYPHTYGFVALNPDQAPVLKKWETDLSGLDNHIEDMKAGKIKFATEDEKRKAEQDDQAKLRRLTNQYPNLPKAYAVTEGKAENARLMIKGEPRSLGPEVPRGFLTILGGQKLPPDEKGSGRLELADWIADPKNPLTARVIVNRVWAWHFGRGIVATPDDFGARGEPPSHPELLDYLTSRFIESGWSIKKLHKLIVLTRAYQMASGDNPKNAAIDSKNAYLWKFNRRRLDAEELRDSILAISGNLDLAPAAEPPFPPEMQWRYTQHTPFIANYETNKRSVYLMQQRIRRQPFLDIFDGADPNSVTGLRPVTTTALQALYTMNDPFFHQQADTLAVRIGMAYNTNADRLRYAYRLIYGRVPAPDEIKDDIQFLTAARKSLQGTEVADYQWNRQAWASLMRVLLSSNEFVTLD